MLLTALRSIGGGVTTDGAGLPVSVIMGDVNGLKITDDVFGHKAGYGLPQSVAALLKRIAPAGHNTAILRIKEPAL